MRIILDEVSIIGMVAGVVLGVWVATWYDVYPDLAFRGLLFLGMTVAGIAFIVMSRPRIEFLLLNLWKLAITVALIVVGVLLTGTVQGLVLQSSTFLSAVPLDVQNIYLAGAAISETYCYFGIQAFLGTQLHPVVGVPFPPIFSFLTHQFLYGANPIFLAAVAASFLLQAIFFAATEQLTLPLGIHSGVNALAPR